MNLIRTIASAAVGALLLMAPMVTKAQNPTIDGSIEGERDQYRLLGEWTQGNENNATGFGDHGMLELYGRDGENLYFNVVGEVQSTSGNAFVIFVDVSGQDGVPAGTQLPPSDVEEGPGDKRPFNAYLATHDFETDYGIVLRGTSDSTSAMSIVNYVADTSDAGEVPHEYFFTSEDTVTPDDDTTFANDGTAFNLASENFSGVTASYTDTPTLTEHSGTEAWEFSIPRDQLGAGADAQFQVFAFYVSGNGDFGSANTIPEIPGQAGTNLAGSGSIDFTTIDGDQHTAPAPLPVELAGFSAKADGRSAVLSWQTASETNNAGFEVQHARGSNGGFEKVRFVDGAGTTTEAQSYRIRVNDLEAGTHRFRLRQVDVDGTATLTDPRTVTISMEQRLSVEPVAPNPVSGRAQFSFTTKEAEQVTVALYNTLGQRVQTLYQGTTTAGQAQQVSFNASSLADGAYFVRVQGETTNRVQRVTVME